MAGQVISIPTSALQDAAVKYRKQLLYMPIIGCQDTLQHMTPRPGIRYKAVSYTHLTLPTNREV